MSDVKHVRCGGADWDARLRGDRVEARRVYWRGELREQVCEWFVIGQIVLGTIIDMRFEYAYLTPLAREVIS